MYDLNDNNFLLYAASKYESLHPIQYEFEEDLKRIAYIKRLLKKYRDSGECKERLILNHIIVLSNMFGPEATTNMLFFRVSKEDHHVLKTFLLFLGYMPDRFTVTFNKSILQQENITIDIQVAKLLRGI
jgi:hypothetical protein